MQLGSAVTACGCPGICQEHEPITTRCKLCWEEGQADIRLFSRITLGNSSHQTQTCLQKSRSIYAVLEDWQKNSYQESLEETLSTFSSAPCPTDRAPAPRPSWSRPFFYPKCFAISSAISRVSGDTVISLRISETVLNVPYSPSHTVTLDSKSSPTSSIKTSSTAEADS